MKTTDSMDIFADLTLEDFADAGDFTIDQVLQAQANGEVFSCRIGDEPFDRYPAYQLHNEVRGLPLRTLICAFCDDGGPSLYMFMRNAGDLLGGVSAVEVLSGHLLDDHGIADGVAELSKRDHFERFQAVLKAAESWLACRHSQ